ncbi:MAG: hypothetical protein LH650_03220 [Chloroflexi bacterium]|nr:hypothetical protein [Chloroflexota bacterium]
MHIRSLTGILLLGGSILAAGLLAPATALAKEYMRLDMVLGSECVSGYKLNPTPIIVKLLRADGTTLRTRHDDTTGSLWNVCFGRVPVAGNKLKLDNGDQPGDKRTINVPDLTLVIDRVKNVVSGHAPAGRSLTLGYSECYPAGCTAPIERTKTANSRGRYSKDLSGDIDIDGSDRVEVRYSGQNGDTFSRSSYAPYMAISAPGGISMSCMPTGTQTVQLRTTGGTLRASKSFTTTQDCTGAFGFFRKDGQKVAVHVGNRISSNFAADASLTWPAMSVGGSGTTLAGRCVNDVGYVVFIYRGSFGTIASGTTDGTGHFTTTPLWTFQGGDKLNLICETRRGDQVRFDRTLPN